MCDCETCKHDDQFCLTPNDACWKCLKGDDGYEPIQDNDTADA